MATPNPEHKLIQKTKWYSSILWRAGKLQYLLPRHQQIYIYMEIADIDRSIHVFTWKNTEVHWYSLQGWFPQQHKDLGIYHVVCSLSAESLVLGFIESLHKNICSNYLSRFTINASFSQESTCKYRDKAYDAMNPTQIYVIKVFLSM